MLYNISVDTVILSFQDSDNKKFQEQHLFETYIFI